MIKRLYALRMGFLLAVGALKGQQMGLIVIIITQAMIFLILTQMMDRNHFLMRLYFLLLITRIQNTLWQNLVTNLYF